MATVERPTPTSVFLWNDLPWLLWNGLLCNGIYHMAADTQGPWLLVLRLFLGTAVVKMLPKGQLSAFPYSGHIILIALIQYGYRVGGWWSFITLLVVFGVLPISDALVGCDRDNLTKELEVSLAKKWAFRLATFLVPPLQVYIITWACWAATAKPMTWVELAGLAVSVGIYTGGIGITVSHELSHKATKLEQWLGRLLVVTVTYGHFYVEHVLGHHKKIGTPEDPATARYGESFYSYFPRVVSGEWNSAWEIEGARVKAKGLPAWHNEMYWYTTCSALFCAALIAAFGPSALFVFVVQSLTAIILFETVNYLEHYGLERVKLPNGEYEPVSYRISWDSAHQLTNMLLFKLQRHGDHHMHGGKRFQCLQVFNEPDSPQLPSGYPGCLVLAWIPPLWRAVMHPRLMAHRKVVTAAIGQKWRYGPQPAM